MPNTSGALYADGDYRTVSYYAGNPSTNGNNTIIAAQGGSIKIRVLAVSMSSTGTVNAKFQTGAGGTDISGLYTMTAGVHVELPHNEHGWFETGANALLNLSLSAGVAVGVTLTWIPVLT